MKQIQEAPSPSKLILMKKIFVNADELNMIQTLRNVQAQNQGTANASGNNGSNNIVEEKPKRKYSPQPLFVVLRKARRLFYSQVDKNVANKQTCIKVATESYDNLYPDTLRFELDFRQERDRLVDSTKFCNACHALELNPEYVADHIVFEGKSLVNKVLKEGLQVVGEKVHMFNAPLWKDTVSLYGEAKEEVVND